MKNEITARSKSLKIKIPIDILIPYRSLYSIIVLLFLLPFTVINFLYMIIPGYIEIFHFHESFTIEDIAYVWVPIVSFVLVAANVCYFVRIFKPLKPFLISIESKDTDGLIQFFYLSFLVGIIIGSIIGIFYGFIYGVSVALTCAQFSFLIFGLKVKLKK